MNILKKLSYWLASFIVGFTLFLFLSLFFSPAALAQTSGSACQSDFISCVRTKFRNKFPFDIFNNMPTGTELTCPKVTLMYKEFDICFLYDAVKVLKYPFAISLLVKLYVFA